MNVSNTLQSVHGAEISGMLNNRVMRVGVPLSERLTLGQQDQVREQALQALQGCTDRSRAFDVIRSLVDEAERANRPE